MYNNYRWFVQTGVARRGVVSVRSGRDSCGPVVVVVECVDNELRLRAGGSFRRVLRGFGFNVAKVQYRHMYTGGGALR